jgi:hypothetical protein
MGYHTMERNPLLFLQWLKTIPQSLKKVTPSHLHIHPMYYVVGLVNKFKKMDEFGSYITCKYA